MIDRGRLARNAESAYLHANRYVSDGWPEAVDAMLAVLQVEGWVLVRQEDIAIIEHFVRGEGGTGHLAVDAAFARLFARKE